MHTRQPDCARRRLLRGLGACASAPLWFGAAAVAGDTEALHTGVIPATGERIPAIGMGTWVTFNVGSDEALRRDRLAVMRAFFELGGGMVDSSPMYGSSQAVVGYCLERLPDTGTLFSADKVWTWPAAGGADQMAESRKRWGLSRFDLMQVHNLQSWEGHLETLREHKAEGLVRYIGVTTSHGARHEELERIMESVPVDFVQLTYNILDREAESRLLPLAAEGGIAVIANRPFRRKALIERFEHQPLPPWAGELDCENWAQFLLKFIVSHPVITCAIPATTRVEHMRENMGAMRGRMPNAEMRRYMAEYVASF